MVEKMLKIVGNIFIFFLSCSVALLNARITMEVRAEGLSNNQVMLGKPFTIDVVIDEIQGSVSTPIIKGSDGCAMRLVGTYMSNINGKKLTRYSYTARIDKLGEYIIGPAVMHYQQQQVASNQVQVCVVKDPGITAQKNKGTNHNTKTFLRLMIDTENPFVGQKVGCCLRFYYQDSSLSLQAVGIPELSHFDIKEIGKLETGTTEIEGVSYHYAQWRWNMYPTQSGEFIIPAYHADYDIPLKDNNSNHLLSGFFMFMGNRVDRKRVYSNAVTLKVSPLPYYAGQVHAVGSFERISADIKPSVIKEGEGMVLAIEIEGNGNLQAIATPKLIMPDYLKYYDSNSSIIAPEHNDEIAKKRFEFIVQAMKAGDYEIPEQSFTYFDCEKNAYTTLRTNPLTVTVMPGTNNLKKDIQPTIGPLQQQKDDELIDIDKEGPWYPVSDYKPLPRWLFKLLLFLPCLYILYPILIKQLANIMNNSIRWRRRRALRYAYKKIEYCKKNNTTKELYSVFEKWAKEYDETITVHSIGNILQKSPMTIDLVTEWNIFFERIARAAYAQSDDKDNDELCRMAIQWLDHLEKKI